MSASEGNGEILARVAAKLEELLDSGEAEKLDDSDWEAVGNIDIRMQEQDSWVVNFTINGQSVEGTLNLV